MDNPSYNFQHYASTLAADFNDISNLFPPLENKHNIVGHKLMSANDMTRINILRTGAWVMKVAPFMCKDYRATKKKYQQDTGGGSGAPENYCDWDKRDDKYLNDYIPKQ